MDSVLRKIGIFPLMLLGAAILLASCGGDADPTAVPATAVAATKAPATAVPTTVPTAEKPSRYGGKLVLAAHGPPSHFDFYASGTIANLGSQAAMYNQLIRRDPTDHTVPIIGDLAKSWDISSDGLTYTFNLESGVRFHDGSTLTADDVAASYRRIIFPDTYGDGLVSQRVATFEGIGEINVVDPLTIQFVLKGPRNPAMMLQAFSLQWNLISQKKILEANKGNLRELDDNPGTGPYVFGSRTDDRWVLNFNTDYWNAGNGPNGCPCVETIEHVWLVAWTPELAAAMLGGVVDWAQWLDPKTGRSIGDNPGLNGLIQSIPVVSGIGWNIDHKPFDDKRVRKALALVIDGQALVQANLDLKGFNFGEWFINGTPFAMDPIELRKLPGFRTPTAEDITEAQRLLADAGFPNGQGFPKIDMLTRDTAPSRVLAAAVQAMIKENLNLDGEIRIADVSGIAEDVLAGKFDYANAGYGIILADPSAYIGQGFGPDNSLGYENARVFELIELLAAEPDESKRIGIVNEMRGIFMDEWPMMPFTAGESVFWGYWDHLKGLVDGSFTASYELYRWDNVWLER
jgi:ABC-type transport system substrate-binding protein